MTTGHLKSRECVLPPLLAFAGLALTGCSSHPPQPADDTTLVVRSLLSVLTADGKPTCIDARTRGEPLAIFQRMMAAPDPSRRPLAWYPPQPLRPAAASSLSLSPDALSSGRVEPRPRLATSQSTARSLPHLLQSQINAAAMKLSLYDTRDHIVLDNWANAPLARVRWWVRNRLDSGCSAIYTVSTPVVARNVAFVSVAASHTGTTYAFRKQGTSWTPIAQWADWLY